MTMRRLVVPFAFGALIGGFLFPRSSIGDDRRRDFLIKEGVMELEAEKLDKLRETNRITMDPERRPGWCFIVHPPTSAPYDVFSVHYLPETPREFRGDFKGKTGKEVQEGLKTDTQHVSGIRPFCFDFHSGDPLGEYRIEVFINRALKKTIQLAVVPS
jgi:hypothetical protein